MFPGASRPFQGTPGASKGPSGASNFMGPAPRTKNGPCRILPKPRTLGKAEKHAGGQAGLGHPPWRGGGGRGWPRQVGLDAGEFDFGELMGYSERGWWA